MTHWHYSIALLCLAVAILAASVGASESARRSLKTIETTSASQYTSPYGPTTTTQLLPTASPTLFVGTLDGRITALDWRTGQEKWSYSTTPHAFTDDEHTPSPSIPTTTAKSPPEATVLGEGTHWTGTASHMMFTSSSPLIVPGIDGRIYFNTPGGLARHPLSASEIIRHSPFTPSQQFQHDSHSDSDSTDEHQQRSSVVYLGHKRTSFHALHPDFGLLKTFASPTTAEDAMLIEEEFHLGGIGPRDIVHVSRNDYCVIAVDLATGRELWNVTGGEFVIENYANISAERGRSKAGQQASEHTHFLVTSATKATLQLIDIHTGMLTGLAYIAFYFF
jgi:outer membrane protein assembly factor BamB